MASVIRPTGITGIAPSNASTTAGASPVANAVTPTAPNAAASTNPSAAQANANGPAWIQGPERNEGVDTWKKLQGDVKQHRLSGADAAMLARQTSSIGIIGEAEALRGARKLEGMSNPDQHTFQGLLNNAGSGPERAFLMKALASGHSMKDIEAFAQTIHGWAPSKLIHTINLADDTGPIDHQQNGVKQQFADSCAPTSAQALRGEFDPIYALRVRTNNGDIHSADDNHAFKVDPGLATEQKFLLEKVGGGRATPRNVNGAGVDDAHVDKIMDRMTPYTGFKYSVQPGADFKKTMIDSMCDAMASQLAQGIPTPFGVTDKQYSGGHECLAVAVEGSGAHQRFLVHDPWQGVTKWVSREQF